MDIHNVKIAPTVYKESTDIWSLKYFMHATNNDKPAAIQMGQSGDSRCSGRIPEKLLTGYAYNAVLHDDLETDTINTLSLIHATLSEYCKARFVPIEEPLLFDLNHLPKTRSGFERE